MPAPLCFTPTRTTRRSRSPPIAAASIRACRTYTDGRQGGCAYIDDNAPDNQGALLHIEMVGFEVEEMRGFLRLYPDTMTARLEVDDKKLKPAAVVVPPPVIVGGNTPLEIINNVWATGDYQLLTKEGCGRFTEACDTAIHNAIEPLCGHLRKDPGQNQFNGHAVDAIHFLGGPHFRIYDIIQSSKAPRRSRVSTWLDPPNRKSGTTRPHRWK
jgi:hypothetical protein